MQEFFVYSLLHFYTAKCSLETFFENGKRCLDYDQQAALGGRIFSWGASFNLIFILAQITCKYQPVSVKCNWCLLWADGRATCCLLCQCCTRVSTVHYSDQLTPSSCPNSRWTVKNLFTYSNSCATW